MKFDRITVGGLSRSQASVREDLPHALHAVGARRVRCERRGDEAGSGPGLEVGERGEDAEKRPAGPVPGGEDRSLSMSRRTAPGICPRKYSARPCSGLSKYQRTSAMRMRVSFRCAASHSVDTSGEPGMVLLYACFAFIVSQPLRRGKNKRDIIISAKKFL